MAEAGDVIENPVTGERVVFRKTAAETNGESLEYELYPGLLRLAVLSRDFESEGYATRPPLSAQRALFTPLAALGRLLGHSSR